MSEQDQGRRQDHMEEIHGNEEPLLLSSREHKDSEQHNDVFVSRRRDHGISPRFVLNDFLSPRSSIVTPTVNPRKNSERDKKAWKVMRPLPMRKKERGSEVLQDSLRSRFMANLEKNIDDNDPDDIWTYHRCKDFDSKDPLERRLLEQGITPIYDPEYREVPLFRQIVPDILDLRMFLTSPGPRSGGFFQCHIYRKHEPNKLYPRYKLCLSDGDRFLLSARKRKKSKGSNYAVSIDEHDISNKTGNYFGKLRSNFMGTEFLLYDKGERPSHELGRCLSSKNIRMELGGIIYQRNLFGKGPRRMTVVIPSFSTEDLKPHVFQPLLKGSSTILQNYKSGLDLDRMTVLYNKLPKWNSQVQAYCLTFNGRATPVSKRSFQVDKGIYSMDYKYPISPFQAFAICLSSLDCR